ncbi:MAG: glycerophosphodiester phosphodiesterase [Propionibacteriales bacterium]|nr:glycerophosphodiester phosphodiesterase [Propionibacteriales bacterium]
MLAVAHRAANDPTSLRAALDTGVDLVEADVHAFRGRLEVRHEKSLGPWWLWERREPVRRRNGRVFELRELLEALNGDPRLMLDLKGVHPRLADRVASVLDELAPRAAFTVCTQHWWMLGAFGRLPRVRVVLSAGSRRGLRRLRARLLEEPAYGVNVHRRLLTPAVVAELCRRSNVVLTWPVDTRQALADARRLGVGGVVSKDPAVLRSVLGARDG